MQNNSDTERLIDFICWFTDKAKEEFPDLDIITAVYTQDGWPQAHDQLSQVLHEKFPHASDDSFREIDENIGSLAATMFPFRDEENLRKKTVVMKIDLDQIAEMAQASFQDPVVTAQATVSHEMGHILSNHLGLATTSQVVENFADIFEMKLMSALGHHDHHETLLQRRIMGVEDPDTLNISRRYGFATVYDEVKALSAEYEGRDLDTVSLVDMVNETDDFVEARRGQFEQWFAFSDAQCALDHETDSDADILGAAAQVDNPLVPIISEVSGIEPNMSFQPACEPNPFTSRKCALQYPKPEIDDAKLAQRMAAQRDKPKFVKGAGIFPNGSLILLPDGSRTGEGFDVDGSARDNEPLFS